MDRPPADRLSWAWYVLAVLGGGLTAAALNQGQWLNALGLAYLVLLAATRPHFQRQAYLDGYMAGRNERQVG